MSGEQTAANVLVALKREATFNTAPGDTGGTRLRLTDSPGLTLERAPIQSVEKRADGLTSMGRLGGKIVNGSYNGELSVGGATDILLEALMRSTWTAAQTITEADMTSITTTTSTIVAAAGSWITEGVRVGDIVYLTGHATAGNNNINLRVITVTATTITVAGTPLTVDATPDTTFTLNVLKKLVTATTPTRYSHYIEQYDQDIDLTEVFSGVRVVGVRLSFRPNEMAQVTYTLIGVDGDQLPTGSSPYYTSPTLTTTLGLVADDSAIFYNGAAVTTFTGFDLEFQITAAGQPVIGSLVSPDVYDNDLRVTGTITGLRADFSNLTLYNAETEFELSILLEEPSGTPPECLSIFLPVVKISGASAPVGGGDGAKIETLQLMVGPKASGVSGYDAGIANICSSAA